MAVIVWVGEFNSWVSPSNYCPRSTLKEFYAVRYPGILDFRFSLTTISLNSSE